jgi:hypothetical protein
MVEEKEDKRCILICNECGHQKVIIGDFYWLCEHCFEGKNLSLQRLSDGAIKTKAEIDLIKTIKKGQE